MSNEQLLDILPSRVEELEFKMRQFEGEFQDTTSLLQRFLRQQTADLINAGIASIIPLTNNSNVSTLTEDVKLSEDIGVLQFINPNGGARTVRLPATGISNKWYIVVNTATP